MKICAQGLGKIAVAGVVIPRWPLNGAARRLWEPWLYATGLIICLAGGQRSLAQQPAAGVSAAFPTWGLCKNNSR